MTDGFRSSVPEGNGSPSVVAHGISVNYPTLVRGSRSRVRRFPLSLTGEKRKVNRAVTDVSLVANQGESIGVVGRNGSGKSTLLRALAGLEYLQSGRVFASSRPQFLGVSPALVSSRTGVENIRLGALSLGLTSEEISAAIPRVLELADLGDAAFEPLSTYSSGMAAKLRFAITTADTKREILFIDEALGTGDAAFQERSKAAVRGILDGAGTVFLVSHAAKTVEEMCDRGLWMHDGKLIMDGPAIEVAKMYRRWAANTNKGDLEAAKRIIDTVSKSYEAPVIAFQS